MFIANLLPLSGTVLEPCAGDWTLAKVMQEERRKLYVRTNDIDPMKFAHTHYDAAQDAMWKELPRPDWVVTNPPFSLAYQILTRAFDHAKEGVAFLLRLSFLEPTIKRAQWLARFPPDLLAVLPRISFTGDGKTDSVTCAWLAWGNTGNAPPLMVVTKEQLKEAA